MSSQRVTPYGSGSSPHTRGARVEHRAGLRRRRIIPAYAGSTEAPSEMLREPRDHPRIRGEHAGGVADYKNGVGSSPHTRGARRFRSVRDRRLGIIPAYAGSTGDAGDDDACLADHPRIRGEHGDDRANLRHQGGIIPAYAGSTTYCWNIELRTADHPRIRGEHLGLEKLRTH